MYMRYNIHLISMIFPQYMLLKHAFISKNTYVFTSFTFNNQFINLRPSCTCIGAKTACSPERNLLPSHDLSLIITS